MTKREARNWLCTVFSVRSMLSNSVGAAVATFMTIMIATYGPGLETRFAPVIEVGPYAKEDIYRDKDTGCFTLHLTKLHAARILKYEFFAETKLSYLLPLSAYLADPVTHKRLADSDLISHSVGSHWDRTYCYDMLSSINDAQCYRVTGHAVHARQPFWNTISEVRSFNTPPLVGNECSL